MGIRQPQKFLTIGRFQGIVNAVSRSGSKCRCCARPICEPFSILNAWAWRRGNFEARSSTCARWCDRDATRAGDDAKVLSSPRHENIWLNGASESGPQGAGRVRSVELGIGVHVNASQGSLPGRHPIQVSSANGQPIDRFGRREQTTVGDNCRHRVDHASRALIRIGILEGNPVFKGRDGELCRDIAGADEEKDTEAVCQSVEKSRPGRQLAVEWAPHISKRNIDDDDMGS